MRFHDRTDAGEQLADALRSHADRQDVLVVAVRASAVPIAHAIAQRLNAPFDLFPVAAIEVPGGPTLGALAPGNIEVLDERVVAARGIPAAAVRQLATRARLAFDRGALQSRLLDSGLARSRAVIAVDDGLVAPAVAEAAVLALRQLGARTVCVAAPVGRREVCERLRRVADTVVCLTAPDPFVSVGTAFDTFEEITDADVRRYVELSDVRAADRGALDALRHRAPAVATDRADLLRHRVRPLTGERADYDSLLDAVSDARIVLLGEGTHGTHEFYRERALITRRLIEEQRFTAVAVEADWPDAYRVNRYIRGVGNDQETVDALGGFRRFPTWMWRNADVLDFLGWLRAHNDSLPASRRTGFYGLDLYSLRASIDAVLGYLAKVDPEAAERARHRYACFDRFGDELQSYAYATGYGLSPSCERDVVAQLMDLSRRRLEYASRDGRIAPDDYFFAQQNARLVRDAEEYYRTMLHGRAESWNLRDRHMAGTLRDLLDFLGHETAEPRVVVWAHNSHIGDARATTMGEAGELNLGQLVREQFGAGAVLVGLTTSVGTVTAATEWDGPATRKEVRPALPGSYERLFHETGIARFLVPMRTDPVLASLLAAPLLERAIGVLYLPATERASHYFHAHLSSQFDYVLHFDETRAVEPLERTSEWEAGELAETWPSGL